MRIHNCQPYNLTLLRRLKLISIRVVRALKLDPNLNKKQCFLCHFF